MENVTEALMMVGSVFLLIIALSVSVSSITSLKVQTEDILLSKEQINEVVEEDASGNNQYVNYITGNEGDGARVVGAEAVTSAMLRIKTETTYKIYIKFKPETLNQVTNIQIGENNNSTNIVAKKAYEQKYIKLDGTEEEIIGDDTGNMVVEFAIGNENLLHISVEDILRSDFYEVIKDLKFKEYLGEYQKNTDTNSIERQTYRVVTFIEES